jgi:hypothetical protein
MRRPGLLAVVVTVSAFAALAAGVARPAGERTCVYRGAKRVGCVYRSLDRGKPEWLSNDSCNNWVWGNRRWLWLQESHTLVAAAKRLSPGRWRIIDSSYQLGATNGYVIWRGRNTWEIEGPKGRRAAVARGPDGPPAGLMVLEIGAECLS